MQVLVHWISATMISGYIVPNVKNSYIVKFIYVKRYAHCIYKERKKEEKRHVTRIAFICIKKYILFVVMKYVRKLNIHACTCCYTLNC